MIRFFYEGLPRYWGQVIRVLRLGLRSVGLLAWLERHRANPFLFYIRCLFCFHDIEDMAHLDVPFWCFRASRRVDAFLKARNGARVFEYGSGASSLWLARRAGHVTSVDHDEHWSNVVHGLASGLSNLDLQTRPPTGRDVDARYRSGEPLWRGHGFDAYVDAIKQAGGPFDLIAIDGRCRADCLRVALPYLKPDGLVVFDNAYRPRYRAAIRGSGLQIRRYRGAVPGLPFPEETMLLAREAAAAWLR